VIDCPPSLNLLTVNAMAASDAIPGPAAMRVLALEGLSQLLQTVEQVRSTLNPNLSIHGIVLTMFDSRNNLSNQVVADVRQFMGQGHNTMIRATCHLRAPSTQAGAGVRSQMRRQRAYLSLAPHVITESRRVTASLHSQRRLIKSPHRRDVAWQV